MQRFSTVVIIAAIPVILFVFYSDETRLFFTSFFQGDTALIEIENTPMRVEIFDTQEERVQGLSGRRELATNSGALFIFPESGYHGIWMKDMLITIDIIWVNEDFEVVHIEENIHPNTYPTEFEPDRPARFVIETSSKYTESFGVDVGDRVRIPDHARPADLRE